MDKMLTRDRVNVWRKSFITYYETIGRGSPTIKEAIAEVNILHDMALSALDMKERAAKAEEGMPSEPIGHNFSYMSDGGDLREPKAGAFGQLVNRSDYRALKQWALAQVAEIQRLHTGLMKLADERVEKAESRAEAAEKEVARLKIEWDKLRIALVETQTELRGFLVDPAAPGPAAARKES